MSEKYIYKCSACGFLAQRDTDVSQLKCGKCNNTMALRRIIYGNKQGTNNCGDYEHISDSLAISPDQIAEHRQLFPDVDVLPDGRPRFTSVRQHERYCEATGFVKQTQRIRNRL